jgi:hypothetical protein
MTVANSSRLVEGKNKNRNKVRYIRYHKKGEQKTYLYWYLDDRREQFVAEDVYQRHQGEQAANNGAAGREVLEKGHVLSRRADGLGGHVVAMQT